MRMSDWSSDVCSSDLGDVEPVHFLAGRAGLDRHQRLSQHLGCVLLHLVDRLRQAHAALGVRGRTDELALAATTCMDLRLDDIKRPGEFFGSGSRLFSGEGGIARRNRRAELRKQFLGLIRSEEPPSELQSLMRISYAVFC